MIKLRLPITKRLRNAFEGLTRWPAVPEWRAALLELAWALPLLLATAAAGGLVKVQAPNDVFGQVGLAAALFIAPALGEELLFRGVMIPQERRPTLWMIVSVILFVLWHPLQALTIGPPWASSFLDPWFLCCVAILGIGLARIYVRTRSLWPCIFTHWIVVYGWKAFLGGPF